jgi:hypothetical protein
MNAPDLERKLRTQFCSLVELHSDEWGGYEVSVPFFFDDGDALFIRIAQDADRLVLTDEGNTLMRLTYQMSPKQLLSGTRRQLLERTLLHYGVEYREGRLILPLKEGSYGQNLADFVQAVLKVSDLTFLTQERTASTFMDDFRAAMRHVVPGDRLTFDWYDPERDPSKSFYVDARVNHMAQPLMVFAITTTEKALHATTNILTFKQWGFEFEAVAVYEDSEKLSPHAAAKLAHVTPVRFEKFYNQRELFEDWISARIR